MTYILMTYVERYEIYRVSTLLYKMIIFHEIKNILYSLKMIIF